MNENDEQSLAAMRQLLEMTDMSDWHLLHNTMRERVRQGELSRDFEAKYKAMVDQMADERENEESE